MIALPSGQLRQVAAVTLLLAVAPLPVLGSSYYEGVLTSLVVIALFAVALNIVFGQTDQLFLFMGGLAGIGGYGTALMAGWFGVSAWVTLPIAALVAGIVGVVVSWISAKRNFTVVLISILTLNLQLVLNEVFVGARDITGGSTGFPFRGFALGTIAEPLGIAEKVVLYYVVLLLLLLATLLYVWLVASKFGVAFQAIREDELAAAAIGIDVVRYKVVAGFLGAFTFGFIGAFYAREASYILPSAYSFLTVDVIVLIVLIVGGLRTTVGPIVGATIVIAIEETLVSTFTNWRSAIFGLLLVLLFLYFRSGVVPFLEARYADWMPGDGGGGAEPAD